MIINNFELDELTYSAIGNANGICNMPTFEAVKNLTLLCENVLEPLRLLLKKPVNISSGFRNSKINILVHGVPDSDHEEGKAGDIWVLGMTPDALFKFIISSGIIYSQLIFEQNFDLNKHWIHISFDILNNKKQNLIGIKRNGKWTYTNY